MDSPRVPTHPSTALLPAKSAASSPADWLSVPAEKVPSVAVVRGDGLPGVGPTAVKSSMILPMRRPSNATPRSCRVRMDAYDFAPAPTLVLAYTLAMFAVIARRVILLPHHLLQVQVEDKVVRPKLCAWGVLHRYQSKVLRIIEDLMVRLLTAVDRPPF